MTIGIIPESDIKGRAVCQFWLQGGKHNVTPTDKNPSDESHPGDLLIYRPPPLFWNGEDYKVPPKKQPKRTHKEILTWLGGGDPLCKLSARGQRSLR